MYTFEIPEWLFVWAICTIGISIFIAIISKLIFKYVNALKVKAERRVQELKQAVEEQKQDQEKRQQDEERRKSELLPGPWRTLYKFLHGQPRATRQSVFLTLESFARDIEDIPKICPWGFDLILGCSYYNAGESGNCHDEAVYILGKYVKFPHKIPEEMKA